MTLNGPKWSKMGQKLPKMAQKLPKNDIYDLKWAINDTNCPKMTQMTLIGLIQLIRLIRLIRMFGIDLIEAHVSLCHEKYSTCSQSKISESDMSLNRIFHLTDSTKWKIYKSVWRVDTNIFCYLITQPLHIKATDVSIHL